MSLPKRDSLTSSDDLTHAQLESHVESMSDALAHIDGFLYHVSYDQQQMRSYFLSIAERAQKCADIVKKPDNAL